MGIPKADRAGYSSEIPSVTNPNGNSFLLNIAFRAPRDGAGYPTMGPTSGYRDLIHYDGKIL